MVIVEIAVLTGALLFITNFDNNVVKLSFITVH